MEETVLVTGGAGFLGSHLVDCLVGAGYSVIVLDDLSGGFQDNIHPSALFIKGSILDADLVGSIFERNRVRYVYHLAAYAAEGLSHFIKRFNYQNNLIGSVNLINASVNHEVSCFVFTSSIAVYGSGQLPMSEEMLPQPEDSYGIAKLAVEQELRISRQMFGLNYIIFRPHNVYGERQNIGDPYRNVVGIMMNQILQGKSLTVFGNGSQTRAFTYVGDVASLIASSPLNLNAYGHVFNVGADKPYQINQLISLIGQVMGVEPNIRYLPPREEVLHAYATQAKVRQYFDCPSDTPLEEGLKRMAAWVQKAGARQSAPFANIEIAREMPPSWRELSGNQGER